MTKAGFSWMAAIVLVFGTAGCGERGGGGGGGGPFDAGGGGDDDAGAGADGGSAVDLDSLSTVIAVSAVHGSCERRIDLSGALKLFVDGAPADDFGDGIYRMSWYLVTPGTHELSVEYDAFGCTGQFGFTSISVAAGDRHLFLVRGEGVGGETTSVTNVRGRYQPTERQLLLVHGSGRVGAATWSAMNPDGSPAGSGTIARDGIEVVAIADPDGATVVTVTDSATSDSFQDTSMWTSSLPDPNASVVACILLDTDAATTQLDCTAMGRVLE